jgi:hypothetical protein
MSSLISLWGVAEISAIPARISTAIKNAISDSLHFQSLEFAWYAHGTRTCVVSTSSTADSAMAPVVASG